MKITVYKDAKGEWRWRIAAGNGRVMADSGEGYRDRADAVHGVQTVTGRTIDTTWTLAPSDPGASAILWTVELRV